MTLLRVAPGRDRKMASRAHGQCGLIRLRREDPGSGRYYLRVKERRIGQSGSASAAQSKQLRVSDVAEIYGIPARRDRIFRFLMRNITM